MSEKIKAAVYVSERAQAGAMRGDGLERGLGECATTIAGLVKAACV